MQKAKRPTGVSLPPMPESNSASSTRRSTTDGALVCVGACFMWVRSYSIRELLYFWQGRVCVHSSRGELSLEYYEYYPGSGNSWFNRNELESWDLDWPIGFSVGIHDPNDAASPPHIRMPYWSVATAAVFMPLAWMACAIRKRIVFFAVLVLYAATIFVPARGGVRSVARLLPETNTQGDAKLNRMNQRAGTL